MESERLIRLLEMEIELVRELLDLKEEELLEEQNVLAVRYEDYVASPAVRQALLQFCELPGEQRFDRYCEAVLRPDNGALALELPREIDGEFGRIMALLGYAP